MFGTKRHVATIDREMEKRFPNYRLIGQEFDKLFIKTIGSQVVWTVAGVVAVNLITNRLEKKFN